MDWTRKVNPVTCYLLTDTILGLLQTKRIFRPMS